MAATVRMKPLPFKLSHVRYKSSNWGPWVGGSRDMLVFVKSRHIINKLITGDKAGRR